MVRQRDIKNPCTARFGSLGHRARGSEEFEGEFGELLLVGGLDEFAYGGARARLQAGDLEQRGAQSDAGQCVGLGGECSDPGPAGAVESGGAVDQGFESGVEGHLVGHVDAFVAQGVAGDPPAAVGLAHQGVRGQDHVVEVDLVEEGVAGDLLQRADVDALGVLHVDQEVAEPPVLGRVRVRPGEQDAVVGPLGGARPHLLAVDPPALGDAFGAGAQRGEVGAGAGFGEQLAPLEFAAQGRQEVAVLLLGRAVGDE